MLSTFIITHFKQLSPGAQGPSPLTTVCAPSCLHGILNKVFLGAGAARQLGGCPMLNQQLKDYLFSRILPRVQMPAQYLGGELNMVRKDHRQVRGKLCLTFPDTYTIGMSHHGLQVLYSQMNARPDWTCERAFTPWTDMEAELRRHQVPLYRLDTFPPLSTFDVLGSSLQYEICYSNVLTMLDLGGIPLHAAERTLDHPLVIAGGPCAQNPEPLAPFIDLFVTGDGEPSLPTLCEEWLR